MRRILILREDRADGAKIGYPDVGYARFWQCLGVESDLGCIVWDTLIVG